MATGPCIQLLSPSFVLSLMFIQALTTTIFTAEDWNFYFQNPTHQNNTHNFTYVSIQALFVTNINVVTGRAPGLKTYTLHLVEVNFECSHRQLTSQSEKKNMSHLFWQSPLSYSLTSHIKGLLIICHLRYFMCSCGSNMILEWKRLQFWWMFPAAFHCTRYWCCAPLIWPVIFILSDSQKCYQYFSAEYMSLKSCVGLLLISKNRASQWVRQHQQNFDYEQSCNLNHNHILIMEDEPKRHNQQPLVSSNFIRWLMKKFLVSVFWLQYLHVTFLKPIFLKSMFSPVGTCCQFPNKNTS